MQGEEVWLQSLGSDPQTSEGFQRILISGKTLDDSCLPLFSFYMLVERRLVVLTKTAESVTNDVQLSQPEFPHL